MWGLLWSFVLVFPLVVAMPAPTALASNTWCDTDPMLVIHTPAGGMVPVYVNVGAQSPLFTPDTLLASLVLSYTAVPTADGTATKVTVVVTVPNAATANSFATRDTISTEAFGTGTVYASASGTSGNPMTSKFELPYP